jgi:hypothetical protein
MSVIALQGDEGVVRPEDPFVRVGGLEVIIGIN